MKKPCRKCTKSSFQLIACKELFYKSNISKENYQKALKKFDFIFLSNLMSSVYHSNVIRMSFVCTRMSSLCHLYVPVCHSYVLVCHPYVTRLYSYIIRMSLACHPYVTRIYSYVTRMPLVCTRMSSVCHSYVLLSHPYFTRMWFNHEPLKCI